MIEVFFATKNKDKIIKLGLKASQDGFDKIKIPTIATDSSLYVEKFDVQPGLFIKRINGVTLNDDELEEHYINELNKVGGTSKAFYVTGLVLVQDGKVNSIEIKEDEFIFTSNVCKHNRNYDPLSRLEYDEKIGKYFCELDELEMDKRGYNFDKEAREFIKNNMCGTV